MSVSELKTHLRIDWSEEDEALARYLRAAREYAEAYTARQLCAATYVMKFDRFPPCGGPIRLPRLPLIAVKSIYYVDAGGASATLYVKGSTNTTPDTGSIDVVDGDDFAEVYPGSGNNNRWPDVYRFGRVTLTFTAGYSSPPSAAQQAILHLAAHWYRNREAVSDLPLKEAPMATHSLLDTIRNYSTF